MPDGLGPYNHNEIVVFFHYAELDLCPYYEQVRRELNGIWISEDLIKEYNNCEKKSSRKWLQCQNAWKSLEPVTEDTTVKSRLCGTFQDSHALIQPVLSYMIDALQSGTVENVKLAIIGQFTTDQISEAKIFCGLIAITI